MPSLEELLSDDQDLLSKVKEKIGDKKLHVTNDGSWIPKEKFNALNDEKKTLSDQLSDRDKQLKDLEKSAGDAEKFKADLERMQQENKEAKDKYEADMKQLKLNTAIRTALTGKVHNPEIATKLLDLSKVEIDDEGAIKGGLEEQLSNLEKSDSYLFVPKDPGSPYKPRGAAPGSSNVSTPEPGGSMGFGKKAAQAKAQAVNPESKTPSPYFS